jgi:hypothetical protein
MFSGFNLVKTTPHGAPADGLHPYGVRLLFIRFPWDPPTAHVPALRAGRQPHRSGLATTQLPGSGLSAVWKYKGIYRLGDQRASLWRNEVSITVGG